MSKRGSSFAKTSRVNIISMDGGLSWQRIQEARSKMGGDIDHKVQVIHDKLFQIEHKGGTQKHKSGGKEHASLSKEFRDIIMNYSKGYKGK